MKVWYFIGNEKKAVLSQPLSLGCEIKRNFAPLWGKIFLLAFSRKAKALL